MSKFRVMQLSLATLAISFSISANAVLWSSGAYVSISDGGFPQYFQEEANDFTGLKSAYVNERVPFGNAQGFLGAGQGMAWISHSTGLLRASASVGSTFPGAAVTAHAYLGEQLTWDLPDFLSEVLITATLRFNGTSGLTFYTSGSTVSRRIAASLSFQDPFLGGSPLTHAHQFITSADINALGMFSDEVSISWLVRDGTSLMLYSGLDLDCRIDVPYAQCESDLSHTGQLSITMPDGVTFKSGSGVFLSAAPPAVSVPEPNVLTLFGLGLVCVGFVRRLRSK